MKINRRERRARAATVAKALLLGYTFERSVLGLNGWVIKDPTEEYMGIGAYRYVSFESEWHAAFTILQRLGIYDEADLRRSKGIGSSSSRKLRKRRRERRRLLGLPEGSGLR